MRDATLVNLNENNGIEVNENKNHTYILHCLLGTDDKKDKR